MSKAITFIRLEENEDCVLLKTSPICSTRGSVFFPFQKPITQKFSMTGKNLCWGHEVPPRDPPTPIHKKLP